jgi:hypothetical protein
VIVPFPAGGPTDAIVRILGERMRVSLGQPLVVEYVTGAAGTIGTGRVARAAPDGYTLLIGHLATNVINAAFYPLSYDVVKDFGRSAAEQPVLPGREEHRPGDEPRCSMECPAPIRCRIAGITFQNMTGTRFRSCPIGSGRRRCRICRRPDRPHGRPVQNLACPHPRRTHQSLRRHLAEACAGA